MSPIARPASPPARAPISPPPRETPVPLTAPVFVPGAEGPFEVLPGTEAYYELRIKNRYYFDEDSLKLGEPLRGRILQTVDATHVRVRAQVRREVGVPSQPCWAWVDDRDWLVTVPNLEGITLGAIVEWLVVPGRGAVGQTADGRETGLRGGRRVTGASLDEYLGAARSTPPEAAALEPAIVSYRLEPTAEESASLFREEAARLRATPRGQRIAREAAEETRRRAASAPASLPPQPARSPRVTGIVTPIPSTSAPPVEAVGNPSPRTPP